MGKSAAKMDANFIKLISANPWKGNIRELKNVMERGCYTGWFRHFISRTFLPANFADGGAHKNPIDLASVEKQHIKKILVAPGGNKTETARLLGIGLTTQYRKLDEYKLE